MSTRKFIAAYDLIMRANPTPSLRPAASQAPRMLPQRLTASANGWDGLQSVEKQEFETQWLPIAEMGGISKQKALQDFLVELTARKQHNDEPSM